MSSIGNYPRNIKIYFKWAMSELAKKNLNKAIYVHETMTENLKLYGKEYKETLEYARYNLYYSFKMVQVEFFMSFL